MRTFTVLTPEGTKIEVECHTRDRREGTSTWGHEAIVKINGTETHKHYIPYYNRTWESFQYRTAMLKAVDKYLKKVRGVKDKDILKHPIYRQFSEIQW